MNSRACWTAGICGCALRSAPDARE
jgi:hypothetical protein